MGGNSDKSGLVSLSTILKVIDDFELIFDVGEFMDSININHKTEDLAYSEFVLFFE